MDFVWTLGLTVHVLRPTFWSGFNCVVFDVE